MQGRISCHNIQSSLTSFCRTYIGCFCNCMMQTDISKTQYPITFYVYRQGHTFQQNWDSRQKAWEWALQSVLRCNHSCNIKKCLDWMFCIIHHYGTHLRVSHTIRTSKKWLVQVMLLNSACWLGFFHRNELGDDCYNHACSSNENTV